MKFLFIAALLLSALGFYRYIYFLSIGYGVAIAGEGLVLLWNYHGKISQVEFLLVVLLICYGIRLSSFLIYREMKSTSYRKRFAEVIKTEKPVGIGLKVAIWVPVSLLYVAQVAPIYFRLDNGAQAESILLLLGTILMVLGLSLETIADFEKSKQKKERPDMVATEGIYRMVRCPNYLGEILFWTGVLVSGVNALEGAMQWTISIIGYICIVFIMVNGTKRLEERQQQSYGTNKEYIEYSNRTPILFPILPLYHLIKRK